MVLSAVDIRSKFGDDYTATEHTYRLGIDSRLSCHFAERFVGRHVLETCTGAGFSTLALARTATHVVTIEIEPEHLRQARANIEKAGLLSKVTFVAGDALAKGVLDSCGPFDSAFLDPDWAVTDTNHIFRFSNSNMRPPVDTLLFRINERTSNVALILPPGLDVAELQGLPPHERELLFLGQSHELSCLYFGDLAQGAGVTEWHG